MNQIKDIFAAGETPNPGCVVTPDGPQTLIRFADDLYRKVAGTLSPGASSIHDRGFSDSQKLPKWRERVLDPFSFSLLSLSARPFHRELGRMYLPIEEFRLQPGLVSSRFKKSAFFALDTYADSAVAIGDLVDPRSYEEKDCMCILFPTHAEFWVDGAPAYVTNDDTATDRAIYAFFRPYLLPSLSLVKEWSDVSPVALKGGYREL